VTVLVVPFVAQTQSYVGEGSSGSSMNNDG